MDKDNQIKNFTILGERCSGTNFLENAMTKNFNIPLTWKFGSKHFFGFNSFEDSDDILFIGIARNPVDWMNSLFRQPYHLQLNLTKNKENFLNGEFWSFNGIHSGSKDGKEKMEDRNIYTGERYKNIFECRKVKLKFLLDDMSGKVKNYIFIKYEDLRDNYDETLDIINNKFNLQSKRKNNTYKKIEGYRGGSTKFQINKNYIIEKNEIVNHKDFNKNIEKRIGYEF